MAQPLRIDLPRRRGSHHRCFPLFFTLALAWSTEFCLAGDRQPLTREAPLDISLRLEINAAISHGASFLASSQNQQGSWASNPCVTAMAVMAYTNASRAGEPPDSADRKDGSDLSSDGGGINAQDQESDPPSAEAGDIIQNALDYLLDCVQEDGSITNRQTKQYSVLSTAISLQALAAHPYSDAHLATIRKSLAFLIAHQSADGGFAPNCSGPSNLSTTLYVMEALYLSSFNTPIEEEDLAGVLGKAGSYISRQTLLKKNREDAFTPPGMPCGPAGQSSAFIRGLIYAGAGPESKKLADALATLDKQFSTTENPGLGQRGYYTYLLSTLKTLRICEQIGIDLGPYTHLKNWRNESARELMKRQTGFGQWRKGPSDWWENKPEIVTANVMFALVNILL